MFFRIINGLYKRLVLPYYTSSCIKNEQENEEMLVMQNIPATSLSPLTEEEKEEVKKTFSPIWGGEFKHFDELGLFKHYHGFNPNFVSHYIYLPVLSHKLNNYHYSKMLEHKSLLGYLAKGALKFPHCYVRCVDGEYYDNDMQHLSREQAIDLCIGKEIIVVKDSVDSSGGKSVKLLCLQGLSVIDKKAELNRVLLERKHDFVIQECLRQHPSLAKFNPTSINTLRVTTLYLNGKFSTLSICLRFGKQGRKVDNFGSGGIIVGVSKEGKLHKKGYDITLNEYQNYNNIHFESEVLTQIPSLLKALETAHTQQFSLCKLIGWDICFNENNEPVVIELNSSQPGLIGEQLCNGPIFGDRTQEVVEYCSKKEFKYQRSLFLY